MALRPIPGTKVRGDAYHLNLRIPLALQAAYGGKTHLRRSLQTGDPKEAERAVRRQKVEFEDKERELDHDARLAERVAALPEHHRKAYEDAGGLEGLTEAFRRAKVAEAFMQAEAPRAFADEEVEGGDPQYGEDGAIVGLSPVVRLPDAAPPDPEPLEFELATSEHRAALGVMRKHAVALGKPLRALGVDVDMEADVTGLQELAEDYCAKKKSPAQTRGDYLYAVRRFIELHGDVPLAKLEGRHLREYDAALAELPAVTSSAELRGLPFRQLVEAARRLPNRPSPIGPKTRAKHISLLMSLSAFAVTQGYFPPDKPDPWAAYKTVAPRTKHSQRKQAREPFSPAQIRNILGHCAQLDRRIIDRWAPLLAAYQGARREEIGQLRGQDVREINGVWCLSITDEGEHQKVKNASSFRTIPLHPKVIEAGFVDFATTRAAEPMLFSELPRWSQQPEPLKPDERGRFTESYGKRFSRLLRAKLGIADKTLVFHSFRHAWEDAADAANMQQSHRRVLAGRSANGDSQAGYGAGPAMSALLESLSKIGPAAG